MSARRTTPVARDQDRELQFLEAALELFVENSFAAVTIKDIAFGCQVNSALLYYYFRNKEDLFSKTVEFAIARLVTAYKDVAGRHPDDPEQLINDWLDVHVQMPTSIRKLIKLMMDRSGDPLVSRGLQRSANRFYAFERTLIADAVRAGVRSGKFRAVEPDGVALFASLHLDGIIAHSIIAEDSHVEIHIGNFKHLFWPLLKNDTTGAVRRQRNGATVASKRPPSGTRPAARRAKRS